MRWWHKVVGALGLRTRGMVEERDRDWEAIVERLREERNALLVESMGRKATAERLLEEQAAMRGQVAGLKRHLRDLTKQRDAIREEAEVQAQADQWRLRQAEQGKQHWLNRASELVDQVRGLVEERDEWRERGHRLLDEKQVLEREAAILRQERDHALNQRDEALVEARRLDGLARRQGVELGQANTLLGGREATINRLVGELAEAKERADGDYDRYLADLGGRSD